MCSCHIICFLPLFFSQSLVWCNFNWVSWQGFYHYPGEAVLAFAWYCNFCCLHFVAGDRKFPDFKSSFFSFNFRSIFIAFKPYQSIPVLECIHWLSQTVFNFQITMSICKLRSYHTSCISASKFTQFGFCFQMSLICLFCALFLKCHLKYKQHNHLSFHLTQNLW